MIINDKNTFSGNNGEYRMWTLDSHNIFQPKVRGKVNIILDFLFPWSQLNLLSLLSKKQEELANLVICLKTATYFEYEEIEERYWTDKHLLDQIQKKTLYLLEKPYILDTYYYFCLIIQQVTPFTQRICFKL